MDIRVVIGRNVRRLRVAKGLTQEELSDRCDFDQRYISQVETGQRNLNALSENGLIDPEMFYESPFTDIDDQGIVGVFGVEKAKEIISIVRRLNAAVAA